MANSAILVSETHTERVLDQEIDTLQICPGHPNYMLLGTYTLKKPVPPTSTAESEDGGRRSENGEADQETQSTAASRYGSIRVLMVQYHAESGSTTDQIYRQCRLDLPCAILDLRICPMDDSLVAAATSIGEIRLFRILGLDDGLVKIVPVGIARVDERGEGEDASAPLVTQLVWLQDRWSEVAEAGAGLGMRYLLAACDTMGRVSIVQVLVPGVVVVSDEKSGDAGEKLLACEVQVVHKHLHDLEAWTVSFITLPSSQNALRQIVLSGGDDSCLIASAYTLDLQRYSNDSKETNVDEINFETPPTRVCLDKQTHTAGVVAIFPLLDSINDNSADGQRNSVPILTGSYDQHLRLFLMDKTSLKLTFVSSIELEGGVWRIALMKSSKVASSQDPSKTQLHHMLLVSAMYAGAYIVRLIRDLEAEEPLVGWNWQIDSHLSKPHESMVYACAASQIAEGTPPTWKIVTTSFYDKRICVWDAIDNVETQA